MEEKNFEKVLKDLVARVEKLEKEKSKNADNLNIITHCPPDDLKINEMSYAGKFETEDKSSASVFGADRLNVSEVFSADSHEMSLVLEAFASQERINIIKQLAKKSCTAKQLMQELKFSTTGKLYHHLSHLEKLGIIAKYQDSYHLSSRMASCVILVFAGVVKVISKQAK